MELKNFHTHTTYCDGKNTAEEMILVAINQGFTALGFSGHSHTSIDPSYCMTTDETRRYINELKALREKYADKIRIYIGLEADLYTDETDLSEFDYTIGSVHYVKAGDVYVPVDESPAQHQIDYVNKYFDGSFISFSQAYYENVAKLGEKINPSFIGHFDLVTKFNENDCLFSTKDPRYIEAWQAAARAAEAQSAVRDKHRSYRKKLPRDSIPCFGHCRIHHRARRRVHSLLRVPRFGFSQLRIQRMSQEIFKLPHS